MLDREIVITFDTAKLAKEKGFNLIVSKAYNLEGELGNYYDIVGEDPFSDSFDECENAIDYDQLRYSAPSQSLLHRWLREERLIHINVSPYLGDSEYLTWVVHYQGLKKTVNGAFIDSTWCRIEKSYEDAMEKGLQEALKLIKL